MSSRTTVAGIVLALAAAVPLSGVAHAEGDFDCRDFVHQEDAQEEFDRNPNDPNRLDEDQGRDDRIACEELPRRDHRQAVRPTHTVQPTQTVTAVPSPLPTRGVAGGVGGTAGPSNSEIGMGVGLAAGGVLVTGYFIARRRRASA